MKNRPAGLRTYMLVCVGSCLIMLTNQYFYQMTGAGDPMRLGAQVVSGIGFLGAGTIIVTKHNQIKGLTTAAGLWASAGVGLALGIGFYEAALTAAIGIYTILTVLQRWERRVHKKIRVLELYLLSLKEGQYSPNHFHWYKTEDIINRGGGNVLIRVYNSLPDESIDYVSEVTVHTDGRTYTVPAGTQIRLKPGESIFIQQYLYHDFEVEAGTGDVLLGEVSQCNDDANDNRFNPPMGRFPEIEEDEPPYRLLCNEYPAAN